MSQKQTRKVVSPPYRKGRQLPDLQTLIPSYSFPSESVIANLQPVKEETKADLVEDTPDAYDSNEAFKTEIERFIEISKYFSSPLHKTASYICENRLVSYPNVYRIESKRGSMKTEHVKFSNITLEPVYLRLFKLIPDQEHIKFTNLSLSRSKRIPPGLSFNLAFVYDNVNEKSGCNAKMIFVASRKTTTPCYQICEIELDIDAQKTRLVNN